MNNYNLTAIKERNDQTFLETSFYWLPGLPVYASKESIKHELESCLNENAEKILNSGIVELYWVDEKNNLTVLNKLLTYNESASFLPSQYRKQVINANERRQPCYFFIEKGIKQNIRGYWELYLRQSCEAEPHKNGYKYGFNLSVVLGNSVHTILINGDLNILDIIEHENVLLPNTVFEKKYVTRQLDSDG